MAEVQTGEFSKFRSNLIDMHADMKVWLWDCGPEKPVAPKRPKPPIGKEGSPDYDLSVLEFKEHIENYEDGLRAYARAKKEYADFEKRNGGPIELMQWSCDARDTLKYDALAVKEGRQTKARWHLSARTRGYDKLENRGLPEGMKPGHGHQAAMERQIAGEKEFVKALQADPVFGQERRA